MQELNFLEVDLVSGGADAITSPYPQMDDDSPYNWKWTKPEQEK